MSERFPSDDRIRDPSSILPNRIGGGVGLHAHGLRGSWFSVTWKISQVAFPETIDLITPAAVIV